MLHTRQLHGIKSGTTLAADGSTTGSWLDLGNFQGSISVSLQDENGASTSMDVSYEVGILPYTEKLNVGGYQELADKLVAITPADAGVIGANVDCNAATNNIVHDTLTLPNGRWFRFTVANDSGMADAKVSLYIAGQV